MEASDGVVRIRRFEASDADPFLEAVLESLDEVGRFMAWCHPAYSRAEATTWVESNLQGGYERAVVDAQTGRLLGGVGLNRLDEVNRWANLGYWIRTSAAGQGACTRAAALAVRFGFEELGLQRIEIFASVENAGSLRVMEKLGALREGTMRRRLQLQGRTHDAVLCSLVDASSLPRL